MLDLSAVKRQVDTMVIDQRLVQQRFEEKLALAREEFQRWSGGAWEKLAVKLQHSKTSWLLAGLLEPLERRFELPPRPERISVAATDGSQIFPDRHEISSCFLINIGYVLLHYGTGEEPLMSSRPTLYYREEELFAEWGGRRLLVNRELVGLKRGLMEFTELAELALAAGEEGYRVLALTDGTLILWNLEGKPEDFKKAYLEAMRDALARLRQARIPVAGYISQPGGQELVNALRVGCCPLEPANCDRCPWKSAMAGEPAELPGDWQPGAGLPCGAFEGIGDAVLVRQLLQPGERTALFCSHSKILEEYGEHRVYFFYIHAGAEIGRVEIPEWVALDRPLLELVHAGVVDQVVKGQGYPVALAEAHERAVVRGADRQAFYRFLQEAFVKNELRAQVSTKNMKKLQADS